MTAAIVTEGLGRRFGGQWALRDCSIEIQAGSVTALVGPNGAGKTTLLALAAGLSRPSAGRIEVLGQDPGTRSGQLLPRVGFVAQEHPLHRDFTVADTLEFGRRMNREWDGEGAAQRIERLGLDPSKKVGKLSGGQQAQVALTLALAKRPELLLLDEPVASLDPLARRDFLSTVMEEAADGELTVVLSSHLLADIERVCDHLLILSRARVLLDGPIEDIVAGHRLLRGPATGSEQVARRHEVVQERHTKRQTTLLVRSAGHVHDSCWQIDDVDLEEIVLAYLQVQAHEEVAA